MFNLIFNWSEVWAPLLPLYVFILKRPKEKYFEIISAYLLTALFINGIIDVSWLFNSCMPSILKNNNFLYNINSICRVFVFVLFFKNAIKLNLKKCVHFFLFLYVFWFVFYFIFLGDFFSLSSFLHSIESISLLILCIIYFIQLIKSEEIFLTFDPYFIIVSGLAIYESVNFFIFLFFNYLMNHNRERFVSDLWEVPNIIFFVFCLFITRAFYGRFKYTISTIV